MNIYLRRILQVLLLIIALFLSLLSVRQYIASKYLKNGKKYKDHGLYFLAMKDLLKGLEYNPYDFYIKAQLGLVYGILGEKALHSLKNNNKSQKNIKNTYLDESISILEEALTYSGDTEVINNLAVSYELKGNIKKSAKLYQMVLKANPLHITARPRLA